MSTKLKLWLEQHVQMFAVGAVLLAVSVVMLPGVAEAQNLSVGSLAKNAATSIDGSAAGTVEVTKPTAPVSGGGIATADSGTVVTENVGSAEQALLTGTVDNSTEVAAPIVPVKGTATVDANVAVGNNVVDQDVCLNVGINNPAGTCALANGAAPVAVDVPAVDGALSATIGTAAGAMDSSFGSNQHATISEQPQLIGATQSTTEVAAPAVPVEGTASVDKNVAVGDTIDEDICVQVGVNTPAGTCGTAAPSDGGASGSVSTDDFIGTVGINDAVDLNNTNVSPQVSLLDSSNEAATAQDAGGSDGSADSGTDSGSVTTEDSTGTIVINDGVDVNNTNVSPQVSVLDSFNESDTEQSAGDSGSGSTDFGEDSGSVTSDDSVGTIGINDGVDVNNTNVSPQVSALDSSNKSGTKQNAGGSDGSGDSGSGSSDVVTNDSLSTIGINDGADVNNTNVSPQISVLDSSNEAGTEQNAGGSASGTDSGDNSGSVTTDDSAGTVGVNDGVDVNNTSVSPQVSLLDSSNEAGTEQSGGDSGSGSGSDSGSVTTDDSTVTVGINDSVDVNNTNVGPQVSVLDSSNESDTTQNTNDTGGDSGSGSNDVAANDSIVTVALNDGADVNNTSVSPQVSVLDSSNESSATQNPDGSDGSTDSGSVTTEDSIGTVGVNDGLAVNNTSVSPQISVLDSSNDSGTMQDAGDSGSGGTDSGSVTTDDSTGTIGINDGVDVNNTDVSPQVSAMDSSNEAGTEQNAGDSGSGNGSDSGSVTTDDSVGTIGINDGVDVNNTSVSPQVSLLDSSNEAGTEQSGGDSGSGSGSDSGSVTTDDSTATVGINDSVDVNNTDVSPQVSVLDSSNDSGTAQNAGSSDSGSGSNDVTTDDSIGTIGVNDGADVNDTNASPQISVLDSSNGAGTEQNAGGSDENADSSNITTEDSIGTVGINDGVEVNNTSVSPQVSVFDSSNESETTQNIGDTGGDSGVVTTDDSIGTVGINDAVNLNNTNVSPQVSVLDSFNESDTEQSAGDSGSGSTDFGEDSGSVTSDDSVGTIGINDGVEVNNTSVSPQTSALDSFNESDTTQNGSDSGSGSGSNVVNTDDSTATVGINDGADINDTSVSPQVSVLNSANDSGTMQDAGGSDSSSDSGSVSTEDSIATVGLNEAVDVNNTNVSPQVSVLDSSNDSDPTQNSGNTGTGGDSGSVSTDDSIGTISINDGIDVNNTNASPQVSLLDSFNESDTEQSAGDSGSGNGSDSGSVTTDESIGTIGLNDAVAVNNTSVSPQVSALDSSNESGTEQNTDGDSGTDTGADSGSDSNDVATNDSIATVGINDTVDLNNTSVSPQVSVLDSSNESSTTQNADDSSSGSGDSGSVTADESIATVGINDGVDLKNTSVSPQVSVLDSSNDSGTEQNAGSSDSGSGSNDVSTDDSIGMVALNDGADVNNTSVSPQVSVLNSSNESNTTQSAGDAGDSGSGSGDSGSVGTADSIGTVGINDAVDLNNTNVSPRVSVLDSSNASGTGQTTDGNDFGSGSSDAATNDSIATVGVNDGVDVNNTNASPQISTLDSSNDSDTTQNSGSTDSGGGSGVVIAEDSVVTVDINDGIDVNNTNISPQVSVLDSSNEAGTEQTSGDSNFGGDSGSVTAEESTGTVGINDAADLNTNASPQVSVLDSSNESDTTQNTGATGGDSGVVTTEDSIATVSLNDGVEVNNTSVSPQVSVLDSSNESSTTQNPGGSDTGRVPAPDARLADGDNSNDGSTPGDNAGGDTLNNDAPVTDGYTPDDGGSGSIGPTDQVTPNNDGSLNNGSGLINVLGISFTGIPEGSPSHLAGTLVAGGPGGTPGASVGPRIVSAGSSIPLRLLVFGSAPAASDLEAASVSASEEKLSSSGPVGTRTLPDTGGSELWIIALGMALIALGGVAIVLMRRGGALR